MTNFRSASILPAPKITAGTAALQTSLSSHFAILSRYGYVSPYDRHGGQAYSTSWQARRPKGQTWRE